MAIKICSKCFSDKIVFNCNTNEWKCINCYSTNYFECDDLCANSVILFNKLGYKTSNSCEGHYYNSEYYASPYIQFLNGIPIGLYEIIFDNLMRNKLVPLIYLSNGKYNFNTRIYGINFPINTKFIKNRSTFNIWKCQLWSTIENVLTYKISKI